MLVLSPIILSCPSLMYQSVSRAYYQLPLCSSCSYQYASNYHGTMKSLLYDNTHGLVLQFWDTWYNFEGADRRVIDIHMLGCIFPLLCELIGVYSRVFLVHVLSLLFYECYVVATDTCIAAKYTTLFYDDTKVNIVGKKCLRE